MTLVRRSLLALFLAAAAAPFAIADTSAKRADDSWWALQKIERPTPPPVMDEKWVRNPIDRFILAKLESMNLQPAPAADAVTLNRRLHFKIIGLPPEPGTQATADELLASPHYGERWARHWLDVARYGESNGFEYDQLRPNAWPYRDWVINAINEDMPYDRFVKLQVAGDILEPNNPDAITATGFLVCGAFDGLIPQGPKQRKIMRQDEMADLVGTVTQSFLGLTVNCARCHDHKFDPITQKEYFQIASALGGVRRGDRNVPASGNAEGIKQQRDDLAKRLAEADAVIREQILSSKKNDNDQADRPKSPMPISRWTFDRDLNDEIGQLHGTAKGSARIEAGALVLDGKSAFVTTKPLTQELKEKTLEAWVKLDGLGQRGGGVITVQGNDGGKFDGIVYGEREPGRWMAGSDRFARTKSFGSGADEKDAASQFVHIAITYKADGTIIGYRNGRPHGKPYKTEFTTYSAGNHQVLFGMRHGTGPGNGRMLSGRIDRAQLYDRALTAEEIALSANVRIVTEKELLANLTDAQKKTRNEWKAEISRLDTELSKLKPKKVYAVTPKGAAVTHLLVRGSPFEPAEEVSAGGVASIKAGGASDFGLAPNADGKERRKKLAEWLAHPDNPLLARVMMNRLWHYHFGQGLVKTPNDLGYSGGKPSHPELLDWLAAEFRAQGWSLKKMHRLILNSATWRQSSKINPKAMQVDAGNLYLWRHSPTRLEAEIIRDAVLAVSGELNKKMGGPGFRDFNMYKHKGSWVYDPIDPDNPDVYRRSIYRTWARGSIHPVLGPLDCPDPSAAAPTRSVTTTPQGALCLMNDSFILRMSERFAERIKKEADNDPKTQAALGILIAFGRPAKEEELDIGSKFIAEHGLQFYCRVLFNSNEFVYIN